jgi:hypothetical protein
MTKVLTVLEGIDPKDLDLSTLPTDCHTVCREDGVIDIMRAQKKTDIFDLYYDLGIALKSITVTGGKISPRMMPQQPQPQKGKN